MSGLGAVRKVPIPVVRCDMCATAEPLELKRSKRTGGHEDQRLDELRTAGWLLTPTTDLCPNCRPHASDRTPQQ